MKQSQTDFPFFTQTYGIYVKDNLSLEIIDYLFCM